MRPSLDLWSSLLAVVFAFVLAHVLAYTYVRSHRALSFSVSFVRILVLMAMATSILIMAIGDSIAYGLGVLGGLAMVQFRSNLRDPRDIVFLFLAVVIGLCAGTGAFALGSVGVLAFCLASFYLNWVPFGSASSYDGILRYTALTGGAIEAARQVLERHCDSTVLSMMQHVSQGEACEHVYQVHLRRHARRESLISELGAVPGVTDLSLMLEDSRVEP